MLTFRSTLLIAVVLTPLCAATLDAQQTSGRRRSVRHTERVARAAWEPVRRAEPAAEHETESRSRVRLAQVQENEALPAPSDPPASVVEVPPGEAYRPAPLDGQIVLEPIHEGSVIHGGPVACDALPGEACGCDSLGCDGTCGGDPTCGELCSPEAWRPCVTLCLPQDGWATFEFLSWYQSEMSLPPLVTSNRGDDVARDDAGVLGRPTTVTLFGGEDVLDDAFDGGRLRFGVWLDRCHTWAIGAEYFALENETATFGATSTGDPILARPFFNTLTGEEDSSLVAFPGVISGTINVAAESELYGWGVHFKRLWDTSEGCSSWLFCGCPDHFCSRTEFLLGYRGMQLDERVRVREESVSTDTNNPGSFDILDRFETQNQFNGFDIGWAYKRTRGYWTFDSAIRLAVGNTHQTVAIDGGTVVDDPNNPPAQTLSGGTLALASNIGTYEQDEFAVVPEFNANIGYQLTDHLKVRFGYTFIYWSNVIRPGDHISRDLNPNLFPPEADPLTGALRPEFAFDTTDYWVQGINVGGEYRW